MDIIRATRTLICSGADAFRNVSLVPWYRGFYGTIAPHASKPDVYEMSGKFDVTGNTITISELPPGRWTTDFREHLKKTFVDTGVAVHPPIDRSTEHSVAVDLVCDKVALDAIRDKLPSMLKLTVEVRTTNMWLWNAHGQLQKFESPHDIIEACAELRLKIYEMRLAHLLEELGEKIAVAGAKLRFIQEERAGTITTSVADEDCIIRQLEERGFHVDSGTSGAYDYLLDMKIRHKTDAAVSHLQTHTEQLTAQLERLTATTPQELWMCELSALEEKINSVCRDEDGSEDDPANANSKRKRHDV